MTVFYNQNTSVTLLGARPQIAAHNNPHKPGPNQPATMAKGESIPSVARNLQHASLSPARSAVSELDLSIFDDNEHCRIINGSVGIVPPRIPAPMPMLRSQEANLENFRYLGFQNTRALDSIDNWSRTVGFFSRDKRFEPVIRRPWRYIQRLGQYREAFSLDRSCYSDEPLMDQWAAVFTSRLIGRYWQEQGLHILPTVTWADAPSYEFAFEGIPINNPVAVSTIGTSENRHLFLDGFYELCDRIQPPFIFCYCNPYPEMRGIAPIVTIEHEGRRAWREARHRLDVRQGTLLDFIPTKIGC